MKKPYLEKIKNKNNKKLYGFLDVLINEFKKYFTLLNYSFLIIVGILFIQDIYVYTLEFNFTIGSLMSNIFYNLDIDTIPFIIGIYIALLIPFIFIMYLYKNLYEIIESKYQNYKEDLYIYWIISFLVINIFIVTINNLYNFLIWLFFVEIMAIVNYILFKNKHCLHLFIFFAISFLLYGFYTIEIALVFYLMYILLVVALFEIYNTDIIDDMNKIEIKLIFKIIIILIILLFIVNIMSKNKQKDNLGFNLFFNQAFIIKSTLPNPIIIPKYIRNEKNCNISMIDNNSTYLSINDNLKMYFQDYNKTRQCVVLVEEREPNIQLNINSKENRYIENHTKIYTILDVGYYDYENKK